MEHSLKILTFFLVCALVRALPAYEDAIDNNNPRNYKNIEILILESAVDQDGGYSFSFENDDGSKVSQEGQRKIIDDEQDVERVSGSFSYNDVNGQPVSLTYTADERGFLPVGAHLPTPPPVPLEILRSLRFLATAKPFVDEQIYDYKPKKKVFRGRQYKTGNVLPRSRNNVRPDAFSRSEETPNEIFLKPEEDGDHSKTETSSETVIETTSSAALETTSEPTQGTTEDIKKPSITTTLEVINESKKKINDALKESIEKTSKITKLATKENADKSITAVREEAAKLTDTVKLEVAKIHDKISGASAAFGKQVSVPAKQSREVIEKYTGPVSDAVLSAPEDSQIDLNVRVLT